MSERTFTQLLPLREQLKHHALYDHLKSLHDLQTFMAQHIFAVWDFMSLLKALQLHLSCTQVPWMPTADPVSRRLINEIVLGEESDALPDGRVISHFEWYYQSMKDCGANTEGIDRLLLELKTQQARSPETVLEILKQQYDQGHLREQTYRFLESTWQVLASGKPHCIAAAFTLGREDIIPTMFHELVTEHSQQHPELKDFVAYLERHIELDGDSHGPLALRMLDMLCQTETQWQEAKAAAKAALEARILLWDGILTELAPHTSRV